MLDKLFVLSQYVTPQLAVSRLAGRFADSDKSPALKNRFTRWFINRYGVDMREAAVPNPAAYATVNECFTWALKPGMRPVPDAADTFICPVDGAISQPGPVANHRASQVKGRSL